MPRNEKPFVVGVDCDGVLADYFRGFRDYVADALGMHPAELPIPSAYDFSSDPAWHAIMPTREKFLTWHNDAIADGLFQTVPAIEGASIALWNLSNAGVYVRIITHRFHKHGTYANVVADTVGWLDQHSIPYRGLAVERWKSDVGCDIYIDDSPANVLELRAAGHDCIVFDAPYNKNVSGLRAHNWQEAQAIIEGRMADRGI